MVKDVVAFEFQKPVGEFAGVAVLSEPTTGSFVMPDFEINSPGAADVELEARGIPPATALHLTFIPETGAVFSTDPDNPPVLQGTQEFSTATVMVTFPSGLTRVFVQASWTP